MEVQQAKVIQSEKGKTKEVKIFLEDNGFRGFTTIRELINTLNIDKEWHEKNGQLEEFLNTPITMQLADIRGQIVEGKICCDVGTCERGSFVLTGNVDNVSFVK